MKIIKVHTHNGKVTSYTIVKFIQFIPCGPQTFILWIGKLSILWDWWGYRSPLMPSIKTPIKVFWDYDHHHPIRFKRPALDVVVFVSCLVILAALALYPLYAPLFGE